MPQDANDFGAELLHYQDDLKRMAEQQLDRNLWGKVDLSGIVQMTLLETVRAEEQFRRLDEAAKAPWLRKVLANNLKDALDHLRTQKRNIELERSLEVSSSHLEMCLAAQQSTPSQQAVRNEQTAQLEAALGQLSEDRRRAVQLHLQGRKLAEIALVLGKNKAAVAQLLSRGIKDLHDLLGQQEKGQQP